MSHAISAGWELDGMQFKPSPEAVGERSKLQGSSLPGRILKVPFYLRDVAESSWASSIPGPREHLTPSSYGKQRAGPRLERTQASQDGARRSPAPVHRAGERVNL